MDAGRAAPAPPAQGNAPWTPKRLLYLLEPECRMPHLANTFAWYKSVKHAYAAGGGGIAPCTPNMMLYLLDCLWLMPPLRQYL
jgi:hypothetical protein